MEDKKTFGAYILRRRREMGMTQKAFAQKLFVTESAVSKWERGLSYPDITMIESICELLGVTEHELLTGSENTRVRRAERLAEKYLRLVRRWRWMLGVAHGAALLGFLIGALVSGDGALFYVALPAVMMSASLSLVPALATDHPVLGNCRASLALGGFTVSLELLLVACWFATGGGNWLAIALTATLFGMGFIVMPVPLNQLPLPERMRRCKTSLYLSIQIALLLSLLLACALTYREGWFPIAALGVLFGLGFFVAPVLLRQLPLPECMRGRKLSAYLLIQTALLLSLLLACALTYREDWFPTAALGVLFGLGFFVVPVLLRQLPLPEPLRGHKLLLYFSTQTLLLFLLICAVQLPLGAHGQLPLALLVALVLLLLPWGDMLLGRYLPASGWFRGAACCAWSALWMWLSPFAVNRLDGIYYGYEPTEAKSLFQAFEHFNLLRWDDYTTWINVYTLLVLALAVAAVGLAIAGWKRGKTK